MLWLGTVTTILFKSVKIRSLSNTQAWSCSFSSKVALDLTRRLEIDPSSEWNLAG